jgi:hypothetical protein
MISQILQERESRYGSFKEHALIAQNLKFEMWQAKKFKQLNADQREALEMIQHKIARILNGDPNYADSWLDIAGYAQQVANRLQQTQKAD